VTEGLRMTSDAAGAQSPEDVLFPDCEPYASGRLGLSPRHSMHWEVCGNPDGVPLVFLHGGPGGGSLPHHRRFYDPSFWRIVLYDQRGAGRSTPVAEITDNTTPHLIADLDRLRAHLGVERWVLFGGSWGSTLALAYAEAHPQRVLGLVLRGIFLATPTEIEWFLYGMRYPFPEAWRAFTGFLPEDEREDLLAAYYRRLTDPDPAVHLPAARAWDRYEAACSTLLPKPEIPVRVDDDAAALAIARIEAHYFVNQGFLAEDELIGNLHRIRHLPCTIVQGRYDIVCPPITADALSRAWPEAEYVIVPDAGHSVREPGITRELVAAVRRLQGRLARDGRATAA
jgi:proline iminopeptidase